MAGMAIAKAIPSGLQQDALGRLRGNGGACTAVRFAATIRRSQKKRSPSKFPWLLLIKHRVCIVKGTKKKKEKICVCIYICIHIKSYKFVSFWEELFRFRGVLQHMMEIHVRNKVGIVAIFKNGETTWNFTTFAWLGKHTNWTPRQNGGNNLGLNL